MLTARYDFAAVIIPNSATLPSGRVIVAGGYGTAGTVIPASTASENLNVEGTPPSSGATSPASPLARSCRWWC